MSGLFGGSEKLNSWTSLCRLFKQGELVNLGWHQVPTKLLSHSTFSGQGKKTQRKLLGGGEDREHLPVTVMGKTDSTWEKMI